MAIVIGRPINDISINGLYYLMNDDNTSMKKFDTIELAKSFLLANGYEGLTDEELEDSFVFEKV